MNQVLVVDDDDDIRETLTEVCRSEGYEVISAHHGREALDLLKTEVRGRCVVLLDLMMPVLDGKGFLEAAALEIPKRLPELFIVVFSAGATVSHPLVRGFLKKPVDLEEVLTLLQANT
jgi:CheY-like chemotaxis protein